MMQERGEMDKDHNATRLEEIENQYGKRIRIPMAHGEPIQEQHFLGIQEDGTKFIYCPIGFIISWSAGDYDHRWCEWCKRSFQQEHYDTMVANGY